MHERRWGACLLAVSCILAAGAAPAPQARADLDRRVQAAAQRLASGDAMGAFLELENVLARDDTLWAAYFHRGRAQVAMGDDLGARESFLRAAELNPGSADLHFLIATAALQLADFDTAWAQAIAAHQAGYDPLAIESMFERMVQYAPAPPDLEARLAAPKVMVSPTDPADPLLDDVLLQLRTMLAHTAGIALVQEASRASFRVDLSRPAPGRLLMTAIEIASGRELGRRETALPAAGPDSATHLTMSAFVTDLERWLGEQP